MVLILVVLAIIARFFTNYSNWLIALALTAAFIFFASLADNPPQRPHLVIAIFISPLAFLIFYLLVRSLGWVKSKLKRNNWGRQEPSIPAGE
ncbi:MAG: hypothetical protein AAF870_00010 [Pseudomonadota bacterium]